MFKTTHLLKVSLSLIYGVSIDGSLTYIDVRIFFNIKSKGCTNFKNSINDKVFFIIKKLNDINKTF